MPVRELPARPNLEHLKKQARQLLRGYLQADTSAVDRFREAQVTHATPAAKLAQAQLVIAREYGFDNWANLKAQVGALSDDPVEALTGAIKANDAPLVRQVLARYPALKSTLDEPLPNYSFDTPAIVAAVQKDNRDMIDALLAPARTSTREANGGRVGLGCSIARARNSRRISSSAGPTSISMRRLALACSSGEENWSKAILRWCMPAGGMARLRYTLPPASKSRDICWTMARRSMRGMSITNPRPRNTWWGTGRGDLRWPGI